MRGGRSNYIGFVYSFQSIGNYYLALWKKRKTVLTSFDGVRFISVPKGFHVKVSVPVCHIHLCVIHGIPSLLALRLAVDPE